MKSLTYHHIMHGGVPLTDIGVKRFVYYALLDGYKKEDIITYLKDIKAFQESGENENNSKKRDRSI